MLVGDSYFSGVPISELTPYLSQMEKVKGWVFSVNYVGNGRIKITRIA